MAAGKLHLVPLGGLGEFGMNCMAMRWGDDILVIDAGMMFPESELLGVDIVSCEQDHTADEGVTHQLALLGGDGGALEVDHQGAETHVARPLRLPGVRSASDSK